MEGRKFSHTASESAIALKDGDTRLGHDLVYGFLEPYSAHNAKDRCVECQHYIETWVKESQREIYLGSYLNQ